MLTLLVAQAVAAGFAPAIDTPYRYRIEQVRDEAGAVRRYATQRTIVFRRTPAGIVADLTIDAVDGGLSDGPGAMFERAFARLRGRTIRYVLSDRGDVTDVVDHAALWAMLVDGIAAQAGDDPTRRAMAERLAAPLKSMPERQQVAMLGSILGQVLAPDIVRAGVIPERAVRQRGSPPFGEGADVTGTERVYAQGALLVEERRLSGAIAARTGQPGGQRSVVALRSVDAASGLIMRQTTTVTLNTGSATSVATTRIARLQP